MKQEKAQLNIRLDAYTAQRIKAIATLRGESLEEWLKRVAAPELNSARIEIFEVQT